jgi:hypothetical protein
MKTLTVKNPWAAAILLLGKDVENRTWRTDFKGRILIHSSFKDDKTAYQGMFAKLFTDPAFTARLKFGFILGSVELFGCVNNAKSRWAEPNLWHWQLRDPIVFEKPIPVKGSLGLWEFGGSLPEKV